MRLPKASFGLDTGGLPWPEIPPPASLCKGWRDALVIDRIESSAQFDMRQSMSSFTTAQKQPF